MPSQKSDPHLSFHDLEQTAAVLAHGFESLLSEVEHLVRREQELKDKLDVAHDAYCDLALNPTLIVSESTNRGDVLRKIKAHNESLPDRVSASTSLTEIASRHDLSEAFAACAKLKQRSKPRSGPQVGEEAPNNHATNGAYFEHDLTTRNATPGNLGCPLAGATNGDYFSGSADPITAELHTEGSIGAGTAYALQNPNQCPIRYLDQHSPEEVTKYFENHKHEIPRSHAVCISRYQQNDAKIRQLDAKYGNIQDMIQRLGEKHQQFLPTKDIDEEEGEVPRPASQSISVVVEKWAKNASHPSRERAPPLQPQPEASSQREDESHDERPDSSEKPLREIRVGESPSRPWGISVPKTQQAAASADLSEKAIEPLSLARSEGPDVSAPIPQKHNRPDLARNCQCGGLDRDLQGDDTWKQSRPNAQATPARKRPWAPGPPTVFNGPVFFGYSAEQTSAMIQSGLFGPSSGQQHVHDRGTTPYAQT